MFLVEQNPKMGKLNCVQFIHSNLILLQILKTAFPKVKTVFVHHQIRSDQSLSHVRLFGTPWIAARQASLSITNSEFTQTYVHRVSDTIQPSHPLSSPSPPAPNPSQQQSLFQWVNSSWWPKYWSFSFSINPSKKHPGLISFRMDWLDLLAVQGTLKSLLQSP